MKNGNVSAYFEGNDVLDGSTKVAEEFEFTRGHRKFLLSIRDFLKSNLDENQNTLKLKAKNQPSTAKRKLSQNVIRNVGSKKFKFFTPDPASSEGQAEGSNSIDNLVDNLKNEKSILMGKAITSLIRHTPEKYVKARVKVNQNFTIFDVSNVTLSPKID